MKYEEFKQKTWQDPCMVDLKSNQNEIYSLLEDYNFKTAIIVNTASECGFTRQYKDLQDLYKRFKDQGLIIISQPSNNFGNQEPKDDAEIKNFCETKYNVSFFILPKADVIDNNSTRLYKELSKVVGQDPKWNFHKYIISKKLNRIYSRNHFQEIDNMFIHDIERLLN